MKDNRTFIEKAAVSLGIIKKINFKGQDLNDLKDDLPKLTPPGDLTQYPPPDKWNDWVEYDAGAWPTKVEKHYSIVPTTCFNCESACGMLAYVDKEKNEIRKFEGNPFHPASRGHLCAKGPATINQINDTDRILYPMKQVGTRGEGKWERVSWDEALNDIAGRIRKAFIEERNNEVVYHVGRPGHEGYIERVLNAWGIDGHNSHTNVCSSSARMGYAIWSGYDRPSPDFANAKFILLLSSHLETGHYFNPHAQRIIDGMMKGAKMCAIDIRLSNTAARANFWLAPYPGTESALFLAMAKIIIDEGTYNRDFLENWVNWEQYLQYKNPSAKPVFEDFISSLKEEYKEYTPEFAAAECGVDAKMIVDVAHEIGKAGTAFACHSWRSAAAGNLGGWQTTRALHFISVLMGAVGTDGGVLPNAWNKFKPTMFDTPPAHKFWNELHYPDEYPLTHYEMSIILPYLLKDKRGKLDVYFTRVFNPVWTYPDGMSWIEMFKDKSQVGCHVAITPTWNETAFFADYVLPTGMASERHDLNSYETHAGKWIAFRQPVMREYLRREGKEVQFTYEANVGEVWEEDEFWIELSWRIDPDGSLGIRKHFESPNKPGTKVTIDEYYGHIFNNVPGLPEVAAKENLSPLDYMKKYGAFEINKSVAEQHLKEVPEGSGVKIKDKYLEGFASPSKKQEFFSQTMIDWKWPEYALPGYTKSHVYWREMDKSKNEFALVPTFRLPTMIHTRSGNAKWLVEISNRNPVWINSDDAKQLGIETNDLVKVKTGIGYFVDKVWVTEAIRPGVVACSHHLGRWRREQDPIGNRWAMSTIKIEELGNGEYKINTVKQIERYKSSDPDSELIFWKDSGVHQNITFPVHPDPVSGMHCWHQKVSVEKAGANDAYGDIFVDTKKSYQIYKDWLAMTRPGPGPDNLRRPLWLGRPLKPQKEAYYKK
ncbi:MAG: molybdopterin-dependent oxidoreductase [Bacteroidia bacterium]